MSSPMVSVVVPTFNRLERLRRVLAALQQQDFPAGDFEIVVVSDGSTDGTGPFLATQAGRPGFRSILQDNKGPAAARNAGVAAACGVYVLFLDDDVVPARDLLSTHMAVHRAATTDVAVIGPLLTPQDVKLLPWVEWEQQALVKQYDAMSIGHYAPTARQFYTGNASIRRDLLVSIGGFSESFRRAEDVELAYRLADRGVEFVFSNSAIGWHYAERSFGSWLDTARSYGRNDAIFARDRDQGWLISTVRSEYKQRKWPIRLLVDRCLQRPWLAGVSLPLLRGVATASTAVGLHALASGAYSGIFNLEYYRGFVQELGDPEFFHRP